MAARRSYRKLPPDVRDRIPKALHRYRETGPGDVKAIEAGNAPVKVLRLFRGISQAQLAKAAGFSQAYIAEIETGRKNGTAESLKAIARALGVPLDVLVG